MLYGLMKITLAFFRTALTESAASVLGYINLIGLESLLILQTHSSSIKMICAQLFWLLVQDHIKFRQAGGEPRRAIRKAKNAWM